MKRRKTPTKRQRKTSLANDSAPPAPEPAKPGYPEEWSALGVPEEKLRSAAESAVMLTQESRPWNDEGDVYIDPIHGSDAFSGLDPGQPLKTWREWMRRCPEGSMIDPPSKKFTVHIMNDMPGSDPLIMNHATAEGVPVLISGKKRDGGKSIIGTLPDAGKKKK